MYAAGVFDPATIDSANDPRVLLFNVLTLFVEINIVLAIFNLIPVPPLDGSALLFRVISPMTAWRIRPVLAQYGSIILLGDDLPALLQPARQRPRDADQ